MFAIIILQSPSPRRRPSEPPSSPANQRPQSRQRSSMPIGRGRGTPASEGGSPRGHSNAAPPDTCTPPDPLLTSLLTPFLTDIGINLE
eukprot:751598-Prorocentrum_minimum.AAC.1